MSLPIIILSIHIKVIFHIFLQVISYYIICQTNRIEMKYCKISENIITSVKWFILVPWNDMKVFFTVQPKYYTGRAWAKSGVNNRPCNSLCSLACHFIRAHVSALRVLFDFRFSLFCPEEDKLFFLCSCLHVVSLIQPSVPIFHLLNQTDHIISMIRNNSILAR